MSHGRDLIQLVD